MTKEVENLGDEEKKERLQKDNRVVINLKFNDCPLSLVKAFREDIKTKYGNIYWVKLMDLMRKAEAYDLIRDGLMPQEVPQQEEEKDEGITTFGGKVK